MLKGLLAAIGVYAFADSLYIFCTVALIVLLIELDMIANSRRRDDFRFTLESLLFLAFVALLLAVAATIVIL